MSHMHDSCTSVYLQNFKTIIMSDLPPQLGYFDILFAGVYQYQFSARLWFLTPIIFFRQLGCSSWQFNNHHIANVGENIF